VTYVSPDEIELWKEMRQSMNNFNGKAGSVASQISPFDCGTHAPSFSDDCVPKLA